MEGWLKALIATACCVVIAGGTLVIYREIFSSPDKTALHPSPRKIAECEDEIAKAMVRPLDKPYPEGEGRYTAIQITDCEDWGLLSPNYKSFLNKGPVGEFLRAYQADRSVWASS